MHFPGGTSGKEPTCQCQRSERLGFNRRVWKIPWRTAWQPSPGFLPGESHGQRSLTGHSPWGSQRVGHDWVTWRVCMENIPGILDTKISSTWINLITVYMKACIILLLLGRRAENKIAQFSFVFFPQENVRMVDPTHIETAL